MDAETINKRMKEEFDKNRTYDSLEKYAMSELLSPLEDYYSFMNKVKENLSLIKNMDLVFVAVDLEQMWTSESFFLNYINSKIENASDRDKSIIYYLNAMQIQKDNRNWKKDKSYFNYLKKSVDLSKNFCFVNNRKALSNLLKGKKRQILIEEIPQNIEKVYDDNSVQNIDISELLSAKSYIYEFITGVSQTK